MCQSMKQDRIVAESRLYNKLSPQVNHLISKLTAQKEDAEQKAKDGKISEANRLVWKGMAIAYNNALVDLEQANSRAHY